MQMIKMKRYFIAMLAVGIAFGFSGCGKKVSKEKLLDSVVACINKEYKDDKISANITDTDVVLIIKVKDTPKNRAQMMLLGSDEEAGTVMRGKILEALEPCQALAEMVKRNMSLNYGFQIGDEISGITITADELKKEVFDKKGGN